MSKSNKDKQYDRVDRGDRSRVIRSSESARTERKQFNSSWKKTYGDINYDDLDDDDDNYPDER